MGNMESMIIEQYASFGKEMSEIIKEEVLKEIRRARYIDKEQFKKIFF